MFRASLLNNEWKLNEVNFSLSLGILQKFALSTPIADILSSKNFSISEIEKFLSPTLRTLLPNPFSAFLDVDIAVKRIIKAIINKEKIVIFGDYDVDGATSSALFKRYLKMAGVESKIYIPDRIKEGYGPNTNALIALREEGFQLLITVDCGTVAFEPLKAAAKAGLEIIVIDHHMGAPEAPESIAVINPNRYDETSDYGYLCGAGVSFLVILAVNIKLKEMQYFKKHFLSEPNLLSLVDLVALGTVCDIMPLIGLNRAFVKTGLSVLKAGSNLGIKTLLSLCNNGNEITEFTLGFIIGPRINAGGRVGKADTGACLLSTNDPNEALALANELDLMNIKRKEFEGEMLKKAFQNIEKERQYENNIIFVKDEAFHEGVIGILAARIKERYNKPVAVFAPTDAGHYKASLRSTAYVDIGHFIHLSLKQGIIIAGGGHKMAGGLSVLSENFHNLHQFFQENLREKARNENYSKGLLEISAIITLAGLSVSLLEELSRLSPFGAGNPKPAFVIQNILVLKADIMKERHISFILKDELSGKTSRAVFFKAAEAGILSDAIKLVGKKIDCICQIEANEWNGKKNLTLQLLDIGV